MAAGSTPCCSSVRSARATARTRPMVRDAMLAGNAAQRRLPWRMPAALAASQVVHWGSLYYAFSVLAPAMAAELGAPRGAVVGVFSAGLLVQGAAALVTGRLIDRLPCAGGPCPSSPRPRPGS